IYSACSLLDTISEPFVKYFGIYMPKIWDEGQTELVKEQIKKGIVFYLAITLGILTALFYLLRPLMELFLKKDVADMAQMEPLVLIIGLGIISLGLTRILGQIFRYLKKNHLALVYRLFAAACNFGLNFIFIPKWGLIGAGVTTLFSYALLAILNNVYLNLKFDKNFTLSLLKISFAGSCVVLWFNIFPIKHIQGFFVQMFSAGILYVCLMFMLGVVRFKDIKEQNFV
ncbi:MAG: polysaccharide biosynthesis C-terminal domain-containing protein, partial [Candidatus Omnitrophica bacterium]|nr:polysaccharide biosynthesis C-terminal domain-containing protein [Candidatus Omnitrophota bacterium]